MIPRLFFYRWRNIEYNNSEKAKCPHIRQKNEMKDSLWCQLSEETQREKGERPEGRFVWRTRLAVINM